MSDGGEVRPAAAPRGWYPDPMTPARRRYWTGSSWTYATSEAVPVDHPPPLDINPLPDGHRLPDPVGPRPAPPPADAKPPQKKWKWALAVVVGLLVGIAGVLLSNRSSSERTSPPPSSEPAPTTSPSVPPVAGGPSANNDRSTAALANLVVKPEDVPSTARVVVFPGGVGLGQPTLDLCNGTYPSESRRTARFQNAVLNSEEQLVLSTEAVLYPDGAATTQVYAELRSVVAACPSTPVQGPTGQPPVITTFGPAPDAGWPQTAMVNRLAFDLTTDDGSGRPPRRTIAVYLQRGRALLGVYFSLPDRPQTAVEGQTTIPGIVGVFAARLAALPVSVVGA